MAAPATRPLSGPPRVLPSGLTPEPVFQAWEGRLAPRGAPPWAQPTRRLVLRPSGLCPGIGQGSRATGGEGGHLGLVARGTHTVIRTTQADVPTLWSVCQVHTLHLLVPVVLPANRVKAPRDSSLSPWYQ